MIMKPHGNVKNVEVASMIRLLTLDKIYQSMSLINLFNKHKLQMFA
jgi:hypothetical protein